jgi:hypothetical protein
MQHKLSCVEKHWCSVLSQNLSSMVDKGIIHTDPHVCVPVVTEAAKSEPRHHRCACRQRLLTSTRHHAEVSSERPVRQQLETLPCAREMSGSHCHAFAPALSCTRVGLRWSSYSSWRFAAAVQQPSLPRYAASPSRVPFCRPATCLEAVKRPTSGLPVNQHLTMSRLQVMQHCSSYTSTT